MKKGILFVVALIVASSVSAEARRHEDPGQMPLERAENEFEKKLHVNVCERMHAKVKKEFQLEGKERKNAIGAVEMICRAFTLRETGDGHVKIYSKEYDLDWKISRDAMTAEKIANVLLSRIGPKRLDDGP